MQNIVIIDYSLNNLWSVEKSLDLLFEACKHLDISIANHSNYKIEKEIHKNAYSRNETSSKRKEFKRLINYYGFVGVSIAYFITYIIHFSLLNLYFKNLIWK